MSKQAGDSQPKSSAPATAEATMSEAACVLQVGCVYRGEISTRNVDGTYNLTVTQPRATVRNAVLALPVFGGLMGFNVNARLAAGTAVEFGFGNPSFIHAVLPESNMDWLNARNRSAIWGETLSEMKDGADIEHFSNTPFDMVEGEFEIANLFGVAMHFLFTMMRMSAGDRAAVECHLINDMVRVISHQYRHFSGIGEDLIFDHGRPTFERTWSSYRHELANKMSDGEKLGDMWGDEIEHKSLDEKKRWEDIGRYRLIEFIGFAGDFIHSFVTDPPKAINKLSSSELYSGKSNIHRNSDGSILMQSVADIRLERVVRIPVPKRVAHHEDPEVTKARKYRDLTPPEVLRLPDLPKGDTYQLAYHMRSYTRWLSQVHGYARALQLREDYHVPSEVETEEPDWHCMEDDKLAQKGPMEYFDSYACITIVRDGSIMLHDVYGSSVMMSNGNVQISSSRHIDIEAAGDIRMVAGRNFYLKARRNVEITAKLGGIIMSSYAWFRALCQKGTMYLRSDAKADEDPPPTALEDGPVPEMLDNHGVLIESNFARTMVRSDKKIILQVEGSPDDGGGLEDTSVDIELNTKSGNTRLFGENVTVKAQDKLLAVAAQAASLKTPALYGDVGEIDLGYGFFIKYGIVYSKMITTLVSFTNYLFSRKVGPQTDPDNPPRVPVGTHYNHTLRLPEDEPVELQQGESEAGLEARADAEAIARASSQVNLDYKQKNDGPLWQFMAIPEYHWDKLPAPHAQTLTQQAIVKGDLADLPSLKGISWGEWNLQANTIQPNIRIGPLKVGYGVNLKWYVTTTPGGENPRKPMGSPPTTLSLNWTPQAAKLKYLKD
jgi:hypothetical protein